MSLSEIVLLRLQIVASDYFSLPDNKGSAFSPTGHYYRQNGKEHTIYHVP